MTFMQTVALGLKNPQAVCPSSPPQDLGDRSTYIGASAATGCLRKAYLDVVDISIEESMEQTFVFERGHQLESLIRKGLNGYGFKEYQSIETAKKAGGLNLVHQLEVKGLDRFDFIKAHLDFVFVKKNGTILIHEIKSASVLPEQPWDSHLLQLELQMWLVSQKYKMPVQGKIIYHDWATGKNKEFEATRSKTMLSVAIKRAMTLWQAMQANEEPIAEIQLYCDSCPHKGDCPALAFGGQLPKEIESLVKQVQEAAQKEKEAKKIKKNLMSLLKASGLSSAKVGDTSVSLVKVPAKQYVSVRRLKKEHRDVYNALSENVGGYEFLNIV